MTTPELVLETEVRPLIRAVADRLGEDFWQGRPTEIEVTRTDDGTVVVRSDDLWFFHDPATCEPVAWHYTADGREFGSLLAGAITWGHVVLCRAPVSEASS